MGNDFSMENQNITDIINLKQLHILLIVIFLDLSTQYFLRFCPNPHKGAFLLHIASISFRLSGGLYTVHLSLVHHEWFVWSKVKYSGNRRRSSNQHSRVV